MWSPGAAPIDGRCTRRIARHLPRVRLGGSLARFATAREELPLGAPSCLIVRRLCRDVTRCSGASNLQSSWRSSSAAAQRAQGTLASSATRLVAHSMRPCVGVRGACEAKRPEPTSSDASRSRSQGVFDEHLIEKSHRDEVSTRRRRRRVLSTLLSGGRRSSTLLNGRRGHHATYLFQAQHCSTCSG